jgi:hypothetical protein
MNSRPSDSVLNFSVAYPSGDNLYAPTREMWMASGTALAARLRGIQSSFQYCRQLYNQVGGPLV